MYVSIFDSKCFDSFGTSMFELPVKGELVQLFVATCTENITFD